MDFKEELDQYSVSKDIITRVNADGTVIIMKMDDSDSFFKIHGVASRFWPVFEKKCSLDEILNGVVEEFDTSADQVSNDVQKLFHQLVKLDFLVSNK